MKTSMPTEPDCPACAQLQQRQRWDLAWDASYELDPQWTEWMAHLVNQAADTPALPPKTQMLIAIAVNASSAHLYAHGVRRHIRQALALGVTREEIIATLHLVSLEGIQSLRLGMPILQEELAAAAMRRAV